MSDHIDKTIQTFQEKIKEHEAEIVQLKRGINQILSLAGQQPRYNDADLQVTSGYNINIRSDEFFNQPQATCVRTILDRRHTLNLGAAPLEELFNALISGGYDIGKKSEGVAKRNLAISLSKNIAFIRLKNGSWGIRKWYGLKDPKKPSKEVNDDKYLVESPDENENNESITMEDKP